MATIVQPTILKPTIFREYIGAKRNLNELPDYIINPKVDEFHFILAFATETYDETTKTGTGTFNPSWDINVFNVDAIRQLKEAHANAKVYISIGGRGPQYPFNPTEPRTWFENAIKSLKRILNAYNNLIDGIDVYYENINSSDDVFTWCIGELIKSLKEDKLIKEASITPSYSVQRQYGGLYQAYRNYINWVDYPFYSDPGFSTQEEFVNRYFALLNDYPNKILLAGFSTDPNDNGQIAMEDFLAGCQVLLKMKLLPGIFVWDADDSKFQKPPFVVEVRAQQMIVDFNHT